MTNGILFDSRMWESIGGAQDAVCGVTVSIDAATAPTYARNRGASFDRLLGNLDFMAGLHHMLTSLARKRRPFNGGEFSRHLVDIMESAIRSARTGRALALRTTFPFPH